MQAGMWRATVIAVLQRAMQSGTNNLPSTWQFLKQYKTKSTDHTTTHNPKFIPQINMLSTPKPFHKHIEHLYVISQPETIEISISR